MTRSTATFTALVFAAAASFAAAGLLTAAPAMAQGASGVTVTVNGPSPFQPDPANPDSVLPELTGPGVSDVTVTVTNLETGDSVTSSTGNNGTTTVPLPPGDYEVTVEGDGHTGVDYITVGANGETETADFSLDGLPSTDTANGGTDAIDGLADAASDASASGDDAAQAEAQSELDAVASQNQSAVESLDEIADGIMDDLPPHIKNELEDDFAAAETDQEIDDAIDEAIDSIMDDLAAAIKVAKALGVDYFMTPAMQAALDAAERLRAILKKLKEKQEQLQAAQDALEAIASAAADDNSPSYANVQKRANLLNNIQGNLVSVGRVPVQPPRMPQVVHHAPPVHIAPPVPRAPVETPRRVIVLTAGPSR